VPWGGFSAGYVGGLGGVRVPQPSRVAPLPSGLSTGKENEGAGILERTGKDPSITGRMEGTGK